MYKRKFRNNAYLAGAYDERRNNNDKIHKKINCNYSRRKSEEGVGQRKNGMALLEMIEGVLTKYSWINHTMD